MLQENNLYLIKRFMYTNLIPTSRHPRQTNFRLTRYDSWQFAIKDELHVVYNQLGFVLEDQIRKGAYKFGERMRKGGYARGESGWTLCMDETHETAATTASEWN